MHQIEEQLAHLAKTVEELSDVVAKQDAELRDLRRQVSQLIAAETERQRDASGGIFLGDERPPHY